MSGGLSLEHYQIYDDEVYLIRSIQKRIHQSCVDAGWYTDLETGEAKKRNFGEVCMLMVTELAEAYEGYRKGEMDSHLPHRKAMEVEFADTIIRILDTAGAEGFDIAGALQEKFLYNQTRSDHKLENRKKPGGKKT